MRRRRDLRLEKQETQSYQDRAKGIPWNLNPSSLEHSISSEVRVCDNLEQEVCDYGKNRPIIFSRRKN
ncbi:unnamed protein product [Microthlaspi erraticum]|uniref:Uncharacterized protein n=1 Tax=Microthlaspi erraticum TaxID=1685480 RepID=A0A6D2KKD3_9BRAS|nr:unnamed protein product [Microthlaspi erraticum]